MRDSSEIKELYSLWQEKAEDAVIKDELAAMQGDDEDITDAFYKELSFGTGGLRGVIGAGSNRLNIYTIGKASQGVADYIKANYPESKRIAAINFDSRINSDVFAKTAAAIFAANGIKVHIFRELMPVPCLSYAVRKIDNCAVGVMITASHNPSKYNGYKVYGDDGCQITSEAAKEISGFIGKVDTFEGVVTGDFDKLVESGAIEYVSDELITDFVEEVKAQSVVGEQEIDKNVSIVYTPLNGTGLVPIIRALKESGYNNITVVAEQEKPDGNFPTCKKPNPEVREAMDLGIEYAIKHDADILIATDPDCDRVGIAVKDSNGDFVLLSANETGVLLLDYVCAMRKANVTMPADPVMMKTIVTTDMGERIAESYGVRTVNLLTGFKYIGEQIGVLEKEGREDSYIFGFEESYGYLTGTYVRDKDGVNGACMICEMFAYYKTRGISLLDKLEELYERFGYTHNTQHSYEFEGAKGAAKMSEIMSKFRGEMTEIAGFGIKEIKDYLTGVDGLPTSNVLRFAFEDGSVMILRPSGTEPKIKVYFFVIAPDRQSAFDKEVNLAKGVESMLV